MNNFDGCLRRGAVGGTVASVLSTLVLARLGKRDSGSAVTPVNAVSHWLWGDEAARHERVSGKYTMTGYAIHHASSIFWAVLFEAAFARLLARRRVAPTLGAAAATTALACYVDYRITPQRLNPGFEQRLGRASIALVYAAFGLGLAAGALALRHER